MQRPLLGKLLQSLAHPVPHVKQAPGIDHRPIAAALQDFHRATPMVELGRKLTADALDAFEAERAAPPT